MSAANKTFTSNTAFLNALKYLYTDQRVNSLLYKSRPFLSMVKKNEDGGGIGKPIPIIIGGGGSPSNDFAKAQNNQSASTLASFLIQYAPIYNVATINGITIESSRGAGKRAFLDAAKTEIDNKFTRLVNKLAQDLYLDGTGSIGQVGAVSTPANALFSNNIAVTLLDPESVVGFEIGDIIEWRATSGAAGADAAQGYVWGVDRANAIVYLGNGTATYAPAASAFTNWVAGGFLNREGDSSAGVTGNFQSNIQGLAAWLPDTAPGLADSFGGQNRSADVTRLGGWRFDGTAAPIDEAFSDALTRLCREGANPDKIFTNFATWSALNKSMQGKVEIDIAQVNVGTEENPVMVGFRHMKINHPKGFAEVYVDPWCKGKHSYILQMENWSLESIGPAPHMVKNPDGLEFLRISDKDAFETRMRGFVNLACNAPGWNGVLLTAV
jgi:hypothetical protein